MANLNKVMLIGRLTRKPEEIRVRGAVQGAKFGFAVNNRKYNQDSQQWEDVPVFIDVEVWNRGENKLGERALETLRGPDREAGIKASQVFIEGHLKMDSWTDPPEKGGGKRTKLVVVVDNFQYLEPRGDGGEGGGSMVRAAPRQAAPRQAPAAPRSSNYDDYDDAPSSGAPSSRGGSGGTEEEIPF